MFSPGSHRGKLCVTNNLIVCRRIAASDGNGCKGAGVCQNLSLVLLFIHWQDPGRTQIANAKIFSLVLLFVHWQDEGWTPND